MNKNGKGSVDYFQGSVDSQGKNFTWAQADPRSWHLGKRLGLAAHWATGARESVMARKVLFLKPTRSAKGTGWMAKERHGLMFLQKQGKVRYSITLCT